MSELTHASRSGDFATSRRGGVDAYEITFIRARAYEGRTVRQIAKMIGRAVEDVAPHMSPVWEPEAEPEPRRYAVPRRIVRPVRAIDKIALDVAQHYGMSVDTLTGSRRARSVSWPRQEAMWLAHQTKKYSLPQIGDYFGGRDHTTVMHAINRVNERMDAALASVGFVGAERMAPPVRTVHSPPKQWRLWKEKVAA